MFSSGPLSLFTQWKSRLRRRGATAARPALARRHEPKPHPRQSFAAVSLCIRGRGCKAARELAGKRFLVAEAPKLPLAACISSCLCAYETHADRRDEPRRGVDLGISGAFYIGPERRDRRDRRLGDCDRSDTSYYVFMRESRLARAER